MSPAKRLIIAAFVMDIAVAVVGLSVQFKGRVLGATPLQLGLLGTFGALAYTIGCLVTGRISDRTGRRALASAGCFGCGVIWLVMTQAGSPAQLLAMVPFSGGCISLFWPPVQAWLSQVSEGQRRLNRNVGNFNLSWTVGLMLGAPTAGLLWGYGHAVPFLFAAGTILALLVFMQTVRGGGREGNTANGTEPDASRVDADLARHYLHLAWIANFGAWFARGLNGVVFPKLASDLGMSEGLIGVVIATFLGGQLLMFVYLRNHTGWQYRLWPLLASLASGAAGMGIAYVARTPALFAVGFGVAGLGAGVTYSASLFYSLQGHELSRGARTGIHEAVLGSGVFLGPLVGGIVANYVDLQTPYLVAAAAFCAVAIIDLVVWHRTVRPTRAALKAGAEVSGR